MPFRSAIPTLARRFLMSKGSDRFLSFISLVSVLGVALGVLALTVVTSVINGFEGELTRVITGMNGDVILYSRGEPISEAPKVEEKIRKAIPSVKAITASYITEIMAAGPHGVAGSVLEGIDAATIGTVTMVPERVIHGVLPSKDTEVALGSSLAERLGAKVGTEVRLIAPFVGDQDGGTTGTPKLLHVQVVGIVKMGYHEYDSKFIFATLPAVQKYLDLPDRVSAFKLRLAPGADSRAAADTLSENFGAPFRAKDWGQLNRNLFYAIQLEKAVIAIILTVIVIVAAFNVVSTLMMMIHDKTREISILKAMGFRKFQSFGLFCLIGMGIGVVGTGSGILLGALVNYFLARTQFIQLPADVYYIGFLPVVIRWNEISMIGGLALVITFLATCYPAFRVSNRPPLDGLRYE